MASVAPVSKAAAVISVGVIVAIGSGEKALVGVIQEAIAVLVTSLTDRVGLFIVKVSKVTVFVLVTGFGVEVTVGWRVVEGFVMVLGAKTVVLVKVLIEVRSTGC